MEKNNNNLEVFSKSSESMSRYKKALKMARAQHLSKLIENNQNNPRFLFNTVARLTNKQTTPEQNIQFSGNDFMNFEKVEKLKLKATESQS